LKGHEDEVLDVAFDYTGQYLLTASADGTARCYNAITHHQECKMQGHEGEISKVGHGGSESLAVFTLAF
jgi:dynein assembly factor with WDR repeat domains 1